MITYAGAGIAQHPSLNSRVIFSARNRCWFVGSFNSASPKAWVT